MKFYRNPELADSYLENIKSYLRGERELPASKLNTRPQGIHQSNLNDHSCIQKGYFSNVIGQKDMTDTDALNFIAGRLFERGVAFVGELDPVLQDDIWVTPDDETPGFGLTEIKYTVTTSLQEVKDEQPQWVCQMKNQAYAFGVNHINLLIYYAMGNAPSSFFWNKSRPKEVPYRGKELQAWTYEFTDEEIEDNWRAVVERKDILVEAIENETPINKHIVLLELPWNWKYERKNKVVIRKWKDYWQCKLCAYSVNCELFDELVMGIK